MNNNDNDYNEEVLLDEYELYYIFIGSPIYDEEKIASSLGFKKNKDVYKGSFIKNGESWILEEPQLVDPNKNQEYYAIFAFSKDTADQIPLYISRCTYYWFIRDYHSEYGIIEYSLSKQTSNKNSDLFMLKNIKDIEKLGYIRCPEIPKKQLQNFPYNIIGDTYKKDNKFYLIGALENSNHLYRIEETFI